MDSLRIALISMAVLIIILISAIFIFLQAPQQKAPGPGESITNCGDACKNSRHSGAAESGCIDITDCLEPNIPLTRNVFFCGDLEACCCIK